MEKFRIITGNSEDVENQLNDLTKKYDVMVNKMAVTNELVTVLAELFIKL